MTRVKICGITTEKDRDLAVAAGADALGFTVEVPVDTPREITPQTAADLIDGVPPFVTTVLVTMAETSSDIIELLDHTRADAAQIHGDHPPDTVTEIRTASGRRVIKAVDAADPDATAHAAAADALLVDSTRAGGAGGTGDTHDWNRTRSLREGIDIPVILAGGLTPENVARAVRTVEPYGVDVASGVEHTGGRKDPDAVRSFVANATAPPEATHQ